jgi:DNA (cytosine-5)-methyltransferase 1
LSVIIETLTKELWYSFYYKIMKASDYGLPQHRPRIYMVWFDKSRLKSDAPAFIFPPKRELKYTISDVFGWHCDRKIGFTLKLGWKGSAITDRRNWDWYIIDGKERRLSPKEWKLMMWFPENFQFPVSNGEAMKQLWNAVAIDAVQYTGKEIVAYLDKYFIN